MHRMSTTALPETRTSTRTAQKPAPPWNVVLIDDDDHTYDYVVEMMQRVFRRSEAEAWEMAREVDTRGRVVCLTTHREHAELKRDQVMSFGADPRLARSRGAMTAVLEPADSDERDGPGDGAGA